MAQGFTSNFLYSIGATGGYTVLYQFETSTSTPPGTGKIRYNNATPSSVTNIYISETDRNSVDLSTAIDNITIGDKIKVFKESDNSVFHLFTVTAVTDSGSYVTIGVTYLSGNSSFLASDNLGFSWALKGNTGATGSTGATGATGTPALNPSPSNTSVDGITIILTAGENLSFGDVCYIKSDGKLWKADADGSTTYPALLMAAASITANSTGNFLVLGTARNDSWTWTVGGVIYLSTTAGGMTQTQPSATDNVIQVVGIAVTATIIIFRASADYMTHT